MKAIKLTVGALDDLVRRIFLPAPKKREGFAFIVHPRSTYDAANKYYF